MSIDVELRTLTIPNEVNVEQDQSQAQKVSTNAGISQAADEIENEEITNEHLTPQLVSQRHSIKQEREFYLYTDHAETKIVTAEHISKKEFEISILPELTTQVVIRHRLKRMNNNYWKPLLVEKRAEIKEFIISLIHSGDVQLLKKAYTQFQILDSIFPSPFSKDKKIVPNHESILHICARYGERETMQDLLESKSQHFPLEVRTQSGDTILHAAVNEENIETVYSILEYVYVEKEEKGWLENHKIRLHKSSMRSLSKEEKEVINWMQGIDLLNLPNSNNECVIHVCVQNKFYNLLEIFLGMGADLAIQDKYGHNVLHKAAIQNDMTVLKMIIEHQKSKGSRGEIELKDLLVTVDVKRAYPAELTNDIEMIETFLSCYNDESDRNEQLGILLASATGRNQLDLATFLVSKGANLDFESKHGMTPLKLASLRGYNELVDYMLKKGDDPNYNKDRESNAAINNAAKSGHLNLIKTLIQYKASVWDETIMNQSALHSAVNGGHSNIIRFLVNTNKMNPNTKDIHGKTPLCYAVEEGYRDCVKELLNCKADPELPVDEEGHIAVHLAARKNDRNILKLLLDYGANSEVKDNDGKAAIDIALELDYPNILELLLQKKVSLNRDNNELNTPMHTIAICGSYKCADYLLRTAELKIAREQLNAKNVDKETPIDIAKWRGHDSVLITYIEKARNDYFEENPTIYHEFLEARQYEILKKIFDRMCEPVNAGTEILCTPIMLDTNEKGQSPFCQTFSHLLPSLLHKLFKCEDKELREHPIVKKTVEKKLNLYRIWFTLTLLAYVAFLIVLSTSFFLASYECDSDIRAFEIAMSTASIRVLLETVVVAYAITLTFSEMVEFAYGWSKIVKSKLYQRKMVKTQRYINNRSEDEKNQITNLPNRKNYFLFILKCGGKMILLISHIDGAFCYFPSAFLQYIYDSPLDVLGLVSLFLYFFIRFSDPGIAWIFASLAFIAFILSLLKFTRIIPSLGAYIETVKAVFSKDIPRFLVLYLIILAAFVGGSHLAARFNSRPRSELVRLTPLGLKTELCPNDTSQIFFFNEGMTDSYTLLIPLVTGIIFLLDGGPGNREEDIVGNNFYFVIIYFLFSFMIIVVISNILIAQLSETYATLSAQGTFYYRMGLIVTMELESSLAFFLGKYFRQLSSIRTLRVPIEEWKTLLSETPHGSISNRLEILEVKIDKSMAILSEENEKNLTLMEKLVSLGEKMDDVEKNLEHLNSNFGSTSTRWTEGIEQATPREDFSKVKIEERIGMLESSIHHLGFQNTALDNKLNQVLKLLKKKQ